MRQLTVKQAAKYLNCTESKIYRCCVKEYIKSEHVIGEGIRIDKNALDEFKNRKKEKKEHPLVEKYKDKIIVTDDINVKSICCFSNGENLRRYRKKLDITMKVLSECIGVSESVISLYENNKRRITDKVSAKLYAFFRNEGVIV